MAPPAFGGSPILLGRERHILRVCLRPRYGLVDAIRHRHTYAAGVVAYGVCALMAIELAGRSFLAPGTDGSGLTGDRSAGALTAPLSFAEVPPPPAGNR